MTRLTSTVVFKRTVLASLIGLCISQTVFAMQEISDEGLSQTTGEGIALLPENFSFRFNGADNANGGAGTYGAGSIRLIPVGPLSATATAKGYKKADAWLYGLSLSQSNKNVGAAINGSDWGTLYGRPIDTWGTADNPWLFKTLNDENVPNFVGNIENVTYLTLEAPLRHTTLPASGSAESSAYNLKLGLWTDIFQRDAAIAENGLNGLSNRLRLAAVWDGFSINGSNLKVFQTLEGVTSAMGGTYDAQLKINNVLTTKTFNYGLNTNYNKTFGVAGLVRLNSGATDTKRGTVSNQTVTREIVQVNYNPTTNTFSEGAVLATGTTITPTQANATNDAAGTGKNGLITSYDPPTNATVSGSFPSGGMCTTPKTNTSGGSVQAGQCLNQNGFTTRRLRAKGANNWTAPTATSVFRISTQELVGAASDTSTPALGGVVPNFQPNSNADGLFLYDVNINLVLGNLYQPLMLSTDGNNFSIELARIPNVQEVYRRIYTRYEHIDPAASVDSGVSYLGSTCNIYKCGSSTIAGYQGSNATHSSITIGSTEYDPVTNQLTAHKGIGAYGVSIGELKSGTGLQSSVQEDFTQVWKRTRERECGWLGCTNNWTNWQDNWSKVDPKAPLTGQAHPSLNRPDPYETTWRQNTNNQILGIQTTTPSDIAGRINSMQPTGATVSNNFGSAVIDGLLIQHLKFTTTGL
ncbi:hypothetical protein EAH57_11245 [Acinetobacter sp. 2JN-4]|uniref:hypothetical protein n=1 Tax=Acinetobacter sp. 2JN-4 TaxID=2479844 RepID=UPI000EF99A70|nr:hypothetical protein [Acinetobacter sp. 2JN-4]RLZ07926.1 hypothetical protein EAH57_11245 [Acinetobacter sp. 2JN-4]